MRDRSIALVVRHNKILSVRTYRHGDYINELPGGGIEPGESAKGPFFGHTVCLTLKVSLMRYRRLLLERKIPMFHSQHITAIFLVLLCKLGLPILSPV